MDENLLTNWLIAIGTIALAVIAVFQDRIRALLMSPKFDVSIEVAPPDCHKTFLVFCTKDGQVVGKADCYYFRIRVKNSGNQRAELVEVFAAELLKQQADGSFKKMDSFLPMNLLWAHIKRPFFDAISPGMEKHCDLGHVIEPTKRAMFEGEDNPQLGISVDKVLFNFELVVKPNTMSHLIPQGKYRLVLQIAAANTEPVKKNLEITLTGNWHDDETRMFSEGIGIRML